jgi:hypothetical protein
MLPEGFSALRSFSPQGPPVPRGFPAPKVAPRPLSWEDFRARPHNSREASGSPWLASRAYPTEENAPSTIGIIIEPVGKGRYSACAGDHVLIANAMCPLLEAA